MTKFGLCLTFRGTTLHSGYCGELQRPMPATYCTSPCSETAAIGKCVSPSTIVGSGEFVYYADGPEPIDSYCAEKACPSWGLDYKWVPITATPPRISGSCTVINAAGRGWCSDRIGNGWKDPQYRCGQGAVASDKPCSVPNAYGRCRIAACQGLDEIRHYIGDIAGLAEQDCKESNGIWNP